METVTETKEVDDDLIDQTGKSILEHLLHPCTLPFSVQKQTVSIFK